ncbi:cation-translocating P-type ATPase [uncultured Cetobacterium sp.]|uniref:cation-translocating P-type ATPase n=1 Tax=uncultured Cetobacterium sp. TaxID=527638 RepID=UPI00261D88C8|nr:cation-translocating P-type ATPase [uncultured Cetobacterium sp.]
MKKEKIYSKKLEVLFEEFKTTGDGLSSTEIERLKEQYGENKLNEGEKQTSLKIFLEQFKDFLVIILIIAAAISFISGNKESTIVILAVISMNAILGTVQQIKAEKSLESLKKMSSPKATVMRDGEKKEIDSSELLPGDIVYIEAGDIIPSDARVIESYSLMVNESSLTGESESVEKVSNRMPEEDLALGDQKNMVFSGSLVTYGRGVILITAIGMKTELGKIASLLDSTEEGMTPLQKSLEVFGKKLSLGIIILCIVVFLMSVWRGMNILDSLMFAVALAVAAIPEALGSIVTIVLAIGTQKMAKEHAIIKKLHSVESLGCVSVICSDKTGTLTQNKMTVKNLFVGLKNVDINNFNCENSLERQILEYSMLCNDAVISNGEEIGDPTEVALIKLGKRLEKSECQLRKEVKRLKELPFDSERKMMSTLHKIYGKYYMITKGAPDVILNKSVKVLLENDEIKDISSHTMEKIKKANGDYAEKGLRVLAFAIKEINSDREILLEDEKDFTLIGLISMIDPPREESKEAVAECIKAGIKPVMITGDYKVTAKAIAKEIGIYKDGDETLNGVEIEAMTDEELIKHVPKISVYARVSPEHKIRIVSAWQKLGKICAMTGDGVNDAPALKKADVGIAMGITGTEVSKDAASMILTDDNFSTIVKSIVTGRNLYANIKNSIRFLLSGNTAGIFAVFYSSLMGLPVIFAPVHLLFINLLTDSLPAIAIGMEPSHSDVLNDKPREATAPLLDKELTGRIAMEGALIAVFTMIAFYLGLSKGDAGLGSTMAFSTLCLARLFHGFNCRGNGSVFKLGFKKNMFSIYAFLLGAILLYAVLLVPTFYSMFAITKPSMVNFIEINILAFIPTLIIQILKAKKYGR